MKSLDLYKSLVERYSMHVGPPRGFDIFGNGGRFVGEQKTLVPSKQNNRLFAEIAALKFNIEASNRGITPAGFGELVYDDGVNPLNGMLIKEIANRADTMMTFWKITTYAQYLNLDTTVRKLNKSFVGAIDTISYLSTLKLKGVKALSEVAFLRLPANIAPILEAQQQAFAAREELPDEYRLHQNYPNPFNPVTTIELSLPYSSEVTLTVYNVLGQEVGTLLEKQVMEEGIQQVEFYADGLATGVYFYKVIAEQLDSGERTGKIFVDTKKMVYVR